jgi:hypothetical protein
MSSVFSTNNNNFNLLTKTVIPVSSFNTGIIYNGSHYLIGGNAVVYSSDSVKWSSLPIVISGMTSIRNFAWNNPSCGIPKINPFTIACGEGSNTLGYSPDGIYWKGLGNHIFSIRSNKALWNGILWTAIGTGGYWVATSYDGINWLGRDNTFMTEGYDIAWNGNMFIAVGSGGSKMAMSNDGIYWTTSSALSKIFTNTINSIQWTGKIWLATGSGTNTTAISNDGYTWQSTNPKNLIITDASNVFSNTSAASSVTASSLSATYLATYISDNSMNPTSSTEWRSNTSLYNASTGIYTGTTSTTYNNTLSASGEWLQINGQESLNIVYYHISWFTDISSSFFTIPKEWYLLGSSTSTGNWTLIDYFNYNRSTPPINITSNKFVIKLQNIYSNTQAYQYYRIVFPSIFPGGSQTFTRVSELDLFYENENSINNINRHIKPIITPTHVLYQTNIIPFSANTGKRIVYQVTDLYGNLVTNNTLNNGSTYNSIINGSPNTQITSSCFDGENFVITPMSGNICYMNTLSLNTNFNFDTSLNNIAINNNISGNVYSSCYNGQRIILAGTGGNVITYSPIISKNPNGQFVNSLNANSLFSTVYCVASNSGYGPIYIPNRIYFNPDEKITVVGPKSYNKAITSSTSISLGLNNYVPQRNVSIPINTIIYGVMGPYGEKGIVGENTMGSIGYYGNIGLDGLYGPHGPDGSHGDSGDTAETGVPGLMGNQGPNGPRGHIGFNGFNGLDGLTGTIGPTGPKEYGPVDEKLWETNLTKVTTFGNVFISSTSSPTLFDNALNIVGNLNTNNEITTEHIQLNGVIVANKCIVGKPLYIVDPHPYVVVDISGDVSINNKLSINNPPQSSNVYSCDVSGIVYVKKMLINNIMTNYLIHSNMTENTITIDFDKSNTFYVDIGNTITSNFTCILNNYNFNGFGNVLKIKMIVDYKNASFERFFCKFMNISGINYAIRYTQGDPYALFSNSLATNLYIQNITIITSVGGGIWNVICDSVFYSN